MSAPHRPPQGGQSSSSASSPMASPLGPSRSVADDSPPTPAVVFALDDSNGVSDDDPDTPNYLSQRLHHQRQPPHNSDASSLMSSSFASRWSNASGFPDVSIDSTRGTLLGGLPWSDHHDAPFSAASGGDTGTIPIYPRRIWSVSDTKLARYPAAWPRPVHAVHVTRAAPAVIAIRIAACLALRSVAADYDDDAATAHCVTIDQCHFVVHLWRRPKPSRDERVAPVFSPTTLAYEEDSHSVTVECVRIRGPTETFHRTASAIFEAAQALDSGADRRHPRQTGPTEYPRLLKRGKLSRDTERIAETSEPSTVNTDDSTVAVEALEMAFSFLNKDRWDAQSWGMYSLVALVDSYVTKKGVAVCAASMLLGSSSPQQSTVVPQLQSGWIFDLIATRQLPNEKSTPVQAAAAASTRTAVGDDTGRSSTGESSSVRGGANEDIGRVEDTEDQSTCVDGKGVGEALDNQHAGQMRSLALRMFANALQLLSEEDPPVLRSILSAPSQPSVSWISPAFLTALHTDLQGASRPACLSGGRWSTSHEATLAARCLGIIAQHSSRAKAIMKFDDDLLLHLEKAMAIGRSAHAALVTEARQTFLSLTEEDRSC